LAAHWAVEGRRHKTAAALAGGLLHAKVSVQDAEAFIEMVVEKAGDDEPENRIAVVKDTEGRMKDGGAVTGFPTLAKLLTRPGHDGEAIVQHLRELLGIARKIVATYDYTDEAGCLLYQCVRFEPKDFKQRRHISQNEMAWDLKGVTRVLYRLTDLVNADAKATVWIPEGEKDVDNLHALGLVSTTNVCGAGKWLSSYNACLKGRHVVLLADNDEPGREHVKKVAAELIGVAASVRILELPGLPPAGDVSDWLINGTADQLVDLAVRVPPCTSAPGQAEAWSAPIPLGELPEAEPFPLDVFPADLQDFVREGAKALACPPDYFAGPLLVMSGAAMGASRALAVKPNYLQRGVLYLAVVASPGSGKTPAQEIVVEPAHETEERIQNTWDKAMTAYEADMEEYEAKLKAYRKSQEQSSRKKKDTEDQGQAERPHKPDRPILERLTVSDATAEALVPILKENPRGVVLVRDELIGWVQAMNQYREGGKGADQQFWLSAWSSSTVTVDRKKTHDLGPLRVRHPVIGVVGGLTPDKLQALRGTGPRQKIDQDGFIDRILPCFPTEMPTIEENWLEISEEALQKLRTVMDRLRDLKMVPVEEAGVIKGYRPFVVKFTAEGKRAWQQFTRTHAEERNAEDFPPHLIGPWSKLRGYGARLALIVHFLRLACGEVTDENVDGESMNRAARLVAYFKSHTRKMYAVMDADPNNAAAKKLLRWIAEGGRQFTRRDAYRAVRGTCKTVDHIDPILHLLENHGYIRPLPTPDEKRVGRKASPAFEAHPCLFKTAPGRKAANAADGSNSVHSVHCVPGYEEEEEDDVLEGEIP
jgi:hypothetical protein